MKLLASSTPEEIEGEVRAAGLVLAPSGAVPPNDNGDPATDAIVATTGDWSFRRNWYYWTADGPPLHPRVAKELNDCYGGQVRINGCAGGEHSEVILERVVDGYHIDTADGLKALLLAIGRSEA